MGIFISVAFENYRSDFIAMKGQSEKTEEAYEQTKRRLLERFGDIDITLLTFDDVRDWKLWLDRGRSSNTVRNYVVCLRVVLRFLARRGYCVIDRDEIPVPKKTLNDILYLDDQEIDDFIAAAALPSRGYHRVNRLRNIAIMELIAATGLRNAEVCSLNRTSIKNRTFTVIGKGGYKRIGFVSKRAMDAVETYLGVRDDSNRALFVSYQTGGRIKPGTIRRIFERVCEKYGFGGVHPHTFRHSYATRLLKRRVDIRHVKDLMGHKSLDTTAHYTHVVNEDLKEIYDRAYAYY